MRALAVSMLAAALLSACAAPLQRAAAAGDVGKLNGLLGAQPAPDANARGKALIQAAMNGRDDAVRLLLDAGADVDFPDYSTGWSPLAAAAAHLHKPTVRLLLSRGAKPAGLPAFLQSYGWPAGAELLRQVTAPAAAPAMPASSAWAQPAAPVPAPAPAPAAAPVPEAAFSSDVDSPRYKLAERPHDIAVVVGIEEYSDLPKAAYAQRDAEAFAAHARALGVPARNIVLLTGPKAGRAAIAKYVDQWLPRMVQEDSRVYFFFSGHGAPDVKTGQAYLVPWDGDPNFLETTAYPVKRLYEKLGALPAKQVLVAMDSCFSGAGGRSVLASGARPLVTKFDAQNVSGRVTALTASAAEEISGSLDGQRHGAFTYFLLKGLNGDSSDLSAAGLLRYATPRVQEEARRLNRDQTPQLLGDGAARWR